MGIRVIRAGMHTTVQDLGRSGFSDRGFRVCGVMDRRSFRIANLLLDNPENEAVLECILTGPTLEFTSEMIIAIAGADFHPEINGQPAAMYEALYVKKGDILSLHAAENGRTCYIAFSNYLQIPVVMGSRATDTLCGIGGFQGRKLQAGDYIGERIKRRKYLPYFLSRRLHLNEFDQHRQEIRVVIGPQADLFTRRGIETFLSSEYTISASFDRMGVRLDGPFIESKGSDIISDGIVLGAVQVPENGRPIIMLSDHQTTGGYAKIASVISVDLPKLVQRKVDDVITFRAVSLAEAQQLILAEQDEFQAMRDQIHQPCREVLDCRLTARRMTSLFAKTNGQ